MRRSLLSFSSALALSLASLVSAPTSAHAQTVTPDTVAKGRYVLLLHPTSIDGRPIASNDDLVVPMVVALKGTSIAFGGKRGPQLVGSVVGGHVTASHGPSPTLGQMSIDGSMDGSNAISGTFNLQTPRGHKLTGTFGASPYGSGWSDGSGTLGTAKAPGGGAMPTGNGVLGQGVKAPGGGATGAFFNGSGAIGSVNGGRGPNVHWNNGSATLEATSSHGAPGMAGAGPNLTTTSAGSASREDPKTGDGKSGSGDSDSGGFFSSIANAANSVVDAVKGLDILGSKGDADKGTATTTAKAPKQGDGSQAQSGTSWWDSLFGTTNNNPSPITPVHPKRGGNGSVDDRDTYGGNDKLNKGAGGRGGGDGSGSTDRGTSGAGGRNAQGQYISVNRSPGDNPFEVVGDDVLNTQHLVNPAADPIFGPAMRH